MSHKTTRFQAAPATSLTLMKNKGSDTHPVEQDNTAESGTEQLIFFIGNLSISRSTDHFQQVELFHLSAKYIFRLQTFYFKMGSYAKETHMRF